MNIAVALLVSTLGVLGYFLVTYSFAKLNNMQKVILLLPVGKYGLAIYQLAHKDLLRVKQ